MKKIFYVIKALLCKHDFTTLHTYDLYTHQVHCFRCGNKYVVNNRYKWKFKLDEQSEKDYEQLQNDLKQFHLSYIQQEPEANISDKWLSS